MKSVSSAQVVSSNPVSLAKASKILSNFVSIDNGASHAVSVYLRRAAVSFADLNQFHKDLKSHSKSRKKHTQIIAFDFQENDKQSEGSLGIEKSEGNKKKKRKGGEIDDVSGEWSGVNKKKRRKTQGHYPVRGLCQALAIAAKCVQEEPSMRPLVADVVTALTYLASQTYDPQIHPVQNCRKSPSSYRPKVNDNVENLSYDSE